MPEQQQQGTPTHRARKILVAKIWWREKSHFASTFLKIGKISLYFKKSIGGAGEKFLKCNIFVRPFLVHRFKRVVFIGRRISFRHSKLLAVLGFCLWVGYNEPSHKNFVQKFLGFDIGLGGWPAY